MNEITNPTATTELSERAGKALLLHRQIITNERIAAECLVSIGRDLKVMKDEELYKELGCETFGEYCEQQAGVKERQGYNFIRVYEHFGEDKLLQIQSLGIAKLLEVAKLDYEDAEELIESGEAATLTVRQLKEKVEKLQKRTEQLTLDLGESEDKKQEISSKATDMFIEIEKYKEKIAALEFELTKTKNDAKNGHEISLSRIRQLEEEIAELESRPVELAVEKPSEEQLAQIRREIEAEIIEEAENQRDAAVEAALQKEAAKHEAKIAELQSIADRAKQEQADAEAKYDDEIKSLQSIVDKAAKNRDIVAKQDKEIEELKKQLEASAAAPKVDLSAKEKMKFYLGQVEVAINSALEVIEKTEDEQEQAKYRAAMRAVMERISGLIST